MTGILKMYNPPIRIQHTLVHHFRERRVREDGGHEFNFGGLERLGNAVAMNEFRHFRAHHMRAEKLTKRAARINFDWPTPDEVLAKLDEELAELAEARAQKDQEALAEEMGDLLFDMANLARKLKVDPEEALRRANAKFTRRFQHIERRLAEMGRNGPQPLDEMEALWVEAKGVERG